MLAVLGETAEDWEQYRGDVVESLKADGPVQVALAERVARLLWKSARLDRHETATMEQRLAEIPFVVTADRDGFNLGGPGEYDRIESAEFELTVCSEHAEALEALRTAAPDDPIGADDCAVVLRAAFDWVMIPFDRLPGDQSAEVVGRVMKEISRRGVPDPDDDEPDAFSGWDAAQLREAIETCVEARAAVLGQPAVTECAFGALAESADYQRYKADRKVERLRRHAADLTVARTVPRADMHDRLARYDETIHRALSRTLAELRKLQGV